MLWFYGILGAGSGLIANGLAHVISKYLLRKEKVPNGLYMVLCVLLYSLGNMALTPYYKAWAYAYDMEHHYPLFQLLERIAPEA